MPTSASTCRSTSCATNYDAILLTGGATQARDLPIPGRELKGVHFAMEFLPQQNKVQPGRRDRRRVQILATGKHVIVIGGGDTGSDCTGTSNRQGCAQPDAVRAVAAAARRGQVPARSRAAARTAPGPIGR